MALTMERGVNLATSYFRTTYRSTIIGAAAFHFRVRNGNGWGHCAKITRRLANLKPRKSEAKIRSNLGVRYCGGNSAWGKTTNRYSTILGRLFGPQIRQASRDQVEAR